MPAHPPASAAVNAYYAYARAVDMHRRTHPHATLRSSRFGHLLHYRRSSLDGRRPTPAPGALGGHRWVGSGAPDRLHPERQDQPQPRSRAHCRRGAPRTNSTKRHHPLKKDSVATLRSILYVLYICRSMVYRSLAVKRPAPVRRAPLELFCFGWRAAPGAWSKRPHAESCPHARGVYHRLPHWGTPGGWLDGAPPAAPPLPPLLRAPRCSRGAADVAVARPRRRARGPATTRPSSGRPLGAPPRRLAARRNARRGRGSVDPQAAGSAPLATRSALSADAVHPAGRHKWSRPA
jgi:hypothetical protein